MKLNTKLVRLGQESTEQGSVVPPIHVATTYEQRRQDPPTLFYGRGENPTREALETCLAGLENGRHALVFSSGQAAGITALSMLKRGDEIIASDDVYGGTYQLLSQLGQALGVQTKYVALDKPGAVSSALTTNTRLFWLETPTNPLLKVCDIRSLVEEAHAHGAKVLVDNTFATPVLQTPLDLGVDVILHSTSKFLSGHADVIGGALVFQDDELLEGFRHYRTVAGNVPGALDCWLIHRGLKTLGLRVQRQQENAVRVVEYLRSHPKVGAVYFPDDQHPQREIIRSQMLGPGSIISFEHVGDTDAFISRPTLFACAVSLGSVCSLMERPARMTHRPIPAETRARLGISDELVRLAIGIEDINDLIEDLDASL